MSHVLTYGAHSGAKAIAVIGNEYLHDLAISSLVPAGSLVIAGDTALATLSQTSLVPVPAVHLIAGAHHLSAHDIPALGRLAKYSNRLIVSGSMWADSEVESWWKKSSTRKILDSAKMSHKTARKLLEQWVHEVSGLSQAMSTYACEQVRYDPARAVSLARKAAVFDGGLNGTDIDLLAADFRTGDFVEALLQMKTQAALASAEMMDEAQCRAALAQVAAALPLMARINAAVITYPAPSGEASRTTRLPITTLAKYWQVAGRYSPQDVLHRLDLLRYLTESSPRDYSSLVSLVAMW